MQTAVIIPLRSLHDGKRRLSGVLSPEERTMLVQRLFARTYQALRSVSRIEQVWVVSPDPELLAWTARFDALPIVQPGEGLNAGLEYARRVVLARREARSLLVMLPDLPLITTADVAAIVELAADDTVVLAPDRHGRGTNALLVPAAHTLPFCFGVDSLRQHQAAAEALRLTIQMYRAPGTAFDLDIAEEVWLMEDLAGPAPPWDHRSR